MFLQQAHGQGRVKGNYQISHLVLPPACYQRSWEITEAWLCLRLQGPRLNHPGKLALRSAVEVDGLSQQRILHSPHGKLEFLGVNLNIFFTKK
jgi:hypothetical protein